MECDGTGSDEDNGSCHEECMCHRDKDASKVKTETEQKRKRKKFSQPHIGEREMNNIKSLFTDWLKVNNIPRKAKPDKHKMSNNQTLNERRFGFITKMFKNYQYFRQKQRALRHLQRQQDELGEQQKHLEILLNKQEHLLSSASGSSNRSPKLAKFGPHADDVNITITTGNTSGHEPPIKATSNVNESQLNQQTLKEVNNIKAEIAEIRRQQDFLSRQQSQLAVQLAKEQAFFAKVLQLIQLIMAKNQNADFAAENIRPQPVSQDLDNSEEMASNKAGTKAGSAMLQNVQAKLSKLVFRDDSLPDRNDGEGQPMMFLKNDQDDEFNRNERPVLQKNEEIITDPDTSILRVPAEIHRSDLNYPGLRNFVLGRDGLDERGMQFDGGLDFEKEDGDEEEPGPGILVMEKKTLHPYLNVRPNTFKMKEQLQKEGVRHQTNTTTIQERDSKN